MLTDGLKNKFSLYNNYCHEFTCNNKYIFPFQNDTLAHYSSYEETELVHTMQKLASLVVKAENSKLTVSFFSDCIHS